MPKTFLRAGWRLAGSAMPVVLGFSLVSACEDEPRIDPARFRDPVATASSLVWVDEEATELLFLTPEGEEATRTRIAAAQEGHRPQWIQPTVDGTRLLVLTAPESDRVDAIAPQLRIYPASGDGEPIAVDVAASYSHVALSPDGRWAVLHFTSGSSSSGDVVQNANLVTFVDLQTHATRTLTLNGFGGRLREVQFPATAESGAPSTIRIGTRDRAVVAFLAEGEIVLVDAVDPTANQVAVRFYPDLTFSPQETLLRPGNETFPNPALFLRSSASSDVAMLTLVDASDPALGTSAWSVQVSLIPIGRSASDFAALDSDGVPYLVTLDPQAFEFVFTDIRTQQGFGISLADGVDRFYLRHHPTPTGLEPQLVAWSPEQPNGARGGQTIYTLDLADIDKTAGQRPHGIRLQHTIRDLVRLDDNRALAGTDSALYVIDFVDDRVTPLSTPTAFDPRRSTIYGDTLLLGTPGQSFVSSVDLDTLSPTSFQLDAMIDEFFHLPRVGRVAVLHDAEEGHVTFLDPQMPARQTSTTVWGFLFEGLLGDGRRR